MFEYIKHNTPQEEPVKRTARELFIRMYTDTVRIHNERGVAIEEIDIYEIAETALDKAIAFEKVWEDAVAESVENTEIKEQ